MKVSNKIIATESASLVLEPALQSAAIRTLAQQALQHVIEVGDNLQRYQNRLVNRDTQFDGRFKQLPPFANAVDEVTRFPHVERLCNPGSDECCAQVTLQFIYVFLGSLAGPAFDEAHFRATLAAFVDELSVPNWTYYAIANLKNFESPAPLLDLGDGVSVRHRRTDELSAILGWRDRDFDWLNQDWMEGGNGVHVLLASHQTPKSPDNLVLTDANNPMQKIENILLSLRLLKPGDVRVGRVCFTRPAKFSMIGRAEVFAGWSIWHPGPRYRLETTEVELVRNLYDKMIRMRSIESVGQRRMSVALRAFSSIYERRPHRADDRILDAITAFEALLGTGTEISFRLPWRVAGLLARNDDERMSLFNLMRDYYVLRNKIVHGAVLDKDDYTLLNNDESLRTPLRRLIVGFLRLIADTNYQTGRNFFGSGIDAALQHSEQRHQLRQAMSLE